MSAIGTAERERRRVTWARGWSRLAWGRVSLDGASEPPRESARRVRSVGASLPVQRSWARWFLLVEPLSAAHEVAAFELVCFAPRLDLVRRDPEVDVLVGEASWVDTGFHCVPRLERGLGADGDRLDWPSMITTSRVGPSAARAQPARMRFLAV